MAEEITKHKETLHMSNPTDQDYDCLQHARVQTQLLRRLTDHSDLDFGKELMDFKSEAHRWIDETAKKIADEMEKQLDVIDLAFVVLWPSETEKVRLVMDTPRRLCHRGSLLSKRQTRNRRGKQRRNASSSRIIARANHKSKIEELNEALEKEKME